MQQLFRMRDADGNDYDVPNSDMAEFSGAVPNAANVTRYRDADGNDYDVPDADKAEFSAAVPNAQPLRRVSFANGTTRDFTMPEMAKFLRSKEWRESDDYKADREERDRAVNAKLGEDGEMHSPAWAGVKGALKGAVQGAWEGGNAAANKIVKAIPEIGNSLESALGNTINLFGNAPNALGNWFLADSASGKAWLDANFPSETKEWTGYEDWSTKTADKFADVSAMAYKFAPAMATGGSTALVNTMFASDGINAASQTFDNAIENGFTMGEANAAAAASFLVNFYGAKLMTKAGGVAGDVSNPLLRFFGEAGAVGAAMGAQGAGNKGIENVVNGRPITEGMGDAFAEGEVEGFMFHGINAIPGAVMSGWSHVRETRELKEYRRDSLLEVARGEGGGELLNTLLPGEGLDAAIRARKSGEDVSRKIGERAGLPDNMSVAERNEIIDAIARARGERAAQNAVKIDGFRADALNEAIKGVVGGEEYADAIRAEVLSNIKSARELDNPVRRMELVEEAAQKVSAPDEHRAKSMAGMEERARRKADMAEYEKQEAERKAREEAEQNAPRITVSDLPAETPAAPAEKPSAPAETGRGQFPEYYEWLDKTGKKDSDKNWRKFVAENDLDPALAGKRPEPPAERPAVKPDGKGKMVPVEPEAPAEEAKKPEVAAEPPQEPVETRPVAETGKETPEPAKPVEAPSRASDAKENVADRIRRLNKDVETAQFWHPDSVEEQIAFIKRNVPEALEATSYEELLRIRDNYARKNYNPDKAARMERKAGVVSKEQHVMTALNTILEYGFPEESAVFNSKPFVEQLKTRGFNVAERDGRLVVEGDTYQVRDALKKNGFKWDADKKEWYTEASAKVPDGRGKMVKPKTSESVGTESKQDYGITMSEEPSVDGDGVRYVVKDGPGDAHRMMFNSKAEAEARLGELRAERKAIQESPSATLSDGKKVRLLKTDEGWIPYDENYNDLRHGMFKAAKTKAEAVEVAEKGVKWARDVAEENARLKAESAKPKPDGKGKMVKPKAEKPTPPATAETPTSGPEAPKVVTKDGEVTGVKPPADVDAEYRAMPYEERVKAQGKYMTAEIAKLEEAIKGKFDEAKDYRGKHTGWTPKDDAGDIPPAVSVKVPGDGEFRVVNNPDGIAMLKKVAAKFKAPPKKGKTETPKAAIKPPSVTVAKKPKAESAEKEMADFVSTDKTRINLTKPFAEGGMVYASDGGIMVRRPLRKGEKVAANGPKGAARILEGARFDNPDKLDVAATYPKIVQALSTTAKATMGDKGDLPSVEIYRGTDGTIHFRSRDLYGNAYATDNWSKGSRPINIFNGEKLKSILELAAKGGAKEIEIAIGEGNTPTRFRAGDYEGVLMPLKGVDFAGLDKREASNALSRQLSVAGDKWRASLSKKNRETYDALWDAAHKASYANPADKDAAVKALDVFVKKHGKEKFVADWVKAAETGAPPPTSAASKKSSSSLGSPDAESPLRPAPRGRAEAFVFPKNQEELRANIAKAVKVFDGKGKAVAKAHDVVPLSALPKKLHDIGIPDGTIYTRVHNLRKLKIKHGLGVDDVVGLIDACANPVAVLKDYKGDAYIVLTDITAKDLNGRVAPVMAYLTPDANGNYMVSAYSRTVAGERQYVNLINGGNLLFVDKGRVATLPLRGEVKSSFESFSDGDLSGDIVPQKAEPVKGVEINKSEKPSPKNPLGQVVPPEDGSVAQAIDAEIAADEAAAAKGKGKPQGVPPAPAPGSPARQSLDPGYEPESIGAGVKSPVARQQIVDKFKELFGGTVAIRGKNTTNIGKNYAGHYEPGAGIIRSKDPVSLRTIPHELGHHIDAASKRLALNRPDAVKHELINLGRKLYGNKRPNGGYQSEGFAEIIKYYLQGNEAGLKREAPEAYKWLVNTFGKAQPDVMARMDALRDMIDRFQNQSGEQAVKAIRAMNPNLAERAIEKIHKLVSFFNAENWLDTGAFIPKALKASGLDKLLDWRTPLKNGDVATFNNIVENHPVLKWKLYNGKAGARAYKSLESGITDLSGTRRYTYGDLGVATPGHSANEVLPTFKEIFGDFTAREMNEFQNYAIARIAKEAYLDKGLEFGLTAKEVEPTLRKYANNTKFRDALDRYTHYKHGVLHLLVDSGAMSQAQFEAIVNENPIYVKIARRRESSDVFRDKMLKRRGKAVNKRTGSGRQVEDIFDAGLVDDERIISAAFQADLLRSIVGVGKLGEANNAAPGGAMQGQLSVGANWIHEVPNAQGSVKFTAEKLRKQITDAMQRAGQAQGKADADNIFDMLFDSGKDTLSIFKERPSDGKNGLVSIYDQEGKLHTYELPENNAGGWAKGLMGFTDSSKPNIVEQWLQISTAAVRTGATTLNPVFAARNLVKDTLHAATVNEVGIFIPGVSTVQGVAMDLMNTNAKRIYDAMGLPMGAMLGESRLASARKANKYLMSRNWFEAQWNKGVTKAIADFVGFSENGSRIAEFKNVRDYLLKKGASEKAANMLAGCNALDITVDFQRGGEVAKRINRLIPFFNASVQGLNQLAYKFGAADARAWQFETSRGKRAARTVLQGAAFITSLALLSEWYNRSDPERKRKADELKPHEKHNYISFGDVRIPVPYEIGYIFASIPRAVAAELYDGQKGAVAECLNMLRRTLPGLSPRDMSFIGPTIDVAMNESWTGSEIVPEHVMRGKKSYDWYDERTSDFSKALAKAFHPIFGDSKLASPAHLEYWLNSVTGNMYGRTIGAIGKTSTFDKTRPHTYPVVGTFFRNPATASRVVSDFYEKRQDLTRKLGSGAATEDEKRELTRINKAADNISELRGLAEDYRGDASLSATERNDKLEQIARMQTNIASSSKDMEFSKDQKTLLAAIKKFRKRERGFSYKNGKAIPHEWPQEKLDEFKKKRRALQAQFLELMGDK